MRPSLYWNRNSPPGNPLPTPFSEEPTHKIFLDPFLKTFYPELDWGTLAADRAQDLIHHFTTAFLLDVLKGDKEAHKALLPEAVKFEEIQYTTTWK